MSSIDRLNRTLNEASFNTSDPLSIVERFADKHDARVVQSRAGRYVLKALNRYSKEFYLDENDSDCLYILKNRLIERVIGFSSVYLIGDDVASYIPVMPKFDAEYFSIKGAHSIMGLSKICKPHNTTLSSVKLKSCYLRGLYGIDAMDIGYLEVSNSTLNSIQCSKAVCETFVLSNVRGLQSYSGLPKIYGILEINSTFSKNNASVDDFIGKVKSILVFNSPDLDNIANELRDNGIRVDIS